MVAGFRSVRQPNDCFLLLITRDNICLGTSGITCERRCTQTETGLTVTTPARAKHLPSTSTGPPVAKRGCPQRLPVSLSQRSPPGTPADRQMQQTACNLENAEGRHGRVKAPVFTLM